MGVVIVDELEWAGVDVSFEENQDVQDDRVSWSTGHFSADEAEWSTGHDACGFEEEAANATWSTGHLSSLAMTVLCRDKQPIAASIIAGN